jgi:membrane associated rhomboid family serine protease
MDSRRMCPNCRAFITSRDRVCPYCNETVGPRAVTLRDDSPIGGFIPQNRFVTVIILLINFGFYAATVVASMKAGNDNAVMQIDGRTLLAFGAKYPPFMWIYGEWWRLVMAGFLHGGLIHIAMNSWALFDLGAQVDEVYGSSRLLVIYFVSNAFGFFLSTLFSPSLSIGASAGICGLLGAMIALGLRHHNPLGDAIRGTYIRWAVMILIIGFLPMFHIDNFAHLGGMVSGFCVAYAAGEPGRVGSGAERVWRVGAYLSILITVYCFLKMYLSLTQGMQQ